MNRATATPETPAPDTPAPDTPAPHTVERWREAIRTATFANYHHQMGVALRDRGEDAAAMAAFERAIAADPGRYSSARHLAGLLAGAGKPEHARGVLERARALDPDAEALALAEEAEDALDAGKADRAIDLMRQALAGSGRAAAHRPDCLVALAGELLVRGLPEETLRWCDLAAPHAHDRAGLHHRRGGALLVLERHAEAEAELRAAIRAEPERTSSWFLLAHYARIRLDLDVALRAYGLVKDSGDPMRHWSRIMYAHTLSLAGRHAEAVAACDAAGRQEPTLTWFIVYRGLALLAAGAHDAAAADLEEGVRLFPQAHLALTARGLLRLAQNRLPEALEDLPDRRGDSLLCLGLSRLGRARAFLALGRDAEALALVRAVEDEEALGIASALRMLGPYGEALAPLLSGGAVPHGR